MKKITLLLVGLLFVSCGSLSAYVEVVLNGRSVPEIIFTPNAFNRISYQEGSIKSIIGNKNLLDVNIQSGIAFIKPKPDHDEHITITVITSDDEAQDMIIKVADRCAEHVRLVDEKEGVDLLLEKVSTISFLNTLLGGQIPDGYKENHNIKLEKYEVPPPLEMIYLKSIDGSTEVIHIYRLVNNHKKDSYNLDASLFKNSRNLWVLLSNPCLGPKDQSFCYISEPKKGVLE